MVSCCMRVIGGCIHAPLLKGKDLPYFSAQRRYSRCFIVNKSENMTKKKRRGTAIMLFSCQRQ